MSTEKKPSRSMWVQVFVSDAEAFMSAVETLRRQGRGMTLSHAVEQTVIAQAGKITVVEMDQDALDDLKVLRIITKRRLVTEREIFNFIGASVIRREQVERSVQRLLEGKKIEAIPNNRTIRYQVTGGQGETI